MPDLETKLKQKTQNLKELFRPDFLGHDYVCFQFLFSIEPPFYLVANHKEFSFLPGLHPKPTVKINIDNHFECWSLLERKKSGARAFMEGKYSSDGHIILSQRLLYLFDSEN